MNLEVKKVVMCIKKLLASIAKQLTPRFKLIAYYDISYTTIYFRPK
jgi:hypothetical protein